MVATLVLFDIDGTLITSGGAGRRAMERALAAAGCRGLQFSMAGMTDRAIVRRALQAEALEAEDGLIEEILSRYLAILQVTLGNQVQMLRGVQPLIDELAAWPEVQMGLGTGNLAAGAEIKLRPTGLWPRFAFGGFGCDAERRPELLAVAARRGAQVAGTALEHCRVVVVGDTVHDVDAAKANGFACVAVASGGNDRATLAGAAPELLVDSLEERQLLSWLKELTR